MIDIDPQVQPEPEPEGYEFGYYTFDPLPTLKYMISRHHRKDHPKMILLMITYALCL